MNFSSITFNFLGIIYAVLLMIMPSYLYYLGYQIDIIPALDICVVYYFVSFGNMGVLSLFFIGILLDALYGIPVGSSSFALISANYFLAYGKGVLLIKKYYTNITLFIVYSLYILILRSVFTSLWYEGQMDILALIFHILTTIAAYPIIKYTIGLLLRNRENNNEEAIEQR